MTELSDENILEMLSNDKNFDKGFEILIKNYHEKLYWHIRRIVHFHEDADDAIQNTFIKVFKNIKGFKGESKLYTWLYRIASNEAITLLNKKKKKNLTSWDQEVDSLGNKLIADSYFDEDRAQLVLVKAIALLPDKQKIVFNMRYYDEMSYADISEALETSVGALKASFHHALKKVESYIKEHIDYV